MSLLLLGGRRKVVASGGGGGGAWQLPEGYFMPAKMAMTAVYPRPDSETPTTARHRNAYPGIEYRIPVAIQGGAYPFHYEVIAGPAGLTVGQNYGDTDYGVVTWTPASAGSAESVTIRVTDQELNTVDVEWTVTPNTDAFVFLDPSVGSSGAGTIGSPLKLFSDVHLDSTTDTTYSGKILVLRAGTHTFSGPSASSGNWRVDNTAGVPNKPVAFIGYPGEAVTLDCSGAICNYTTAGTGDDHFWGGFTALDARADVANSRFVFFGGDCGDRATFFEVNFDGLGRGTSGGTDNPGAIVRFDGASLSNYFAVVQCSAENYDAPLVGSIYETQYIVIDGCTLGTATDGDPNQALYLKSGCTYATIRNCRSTSAGPSQGVIEHSWAAGSPTGATQYVEVCYNTVRVPSGVAFTFNWELADAPAGSTLWAYRNTFVGRVRALSTVDVSWTGTFEQNIAITDDTSVVFSDSGSKVTKTDNVTATIANIGTVLDGNYLLTGSARATYLGTRGAEISAGV